MQKKRLLLVVLGLAVGTFVLTALLNSSMIFRMASTFMPGMGYGESTQIMPMATEEDAARGLVGSMGMPATGGFAPDLIYPPYYNDDALQVEDRVYLHNASHSVIVENVPEYLSQLREYLTSVDGRVLSYSVNTAQKYQSGYIRAKVPVDRFDEANSRVNEGVEEVINESVNSQDVTGTVVNRQDQVESLQQQLDERRIQLAGLEEGTTQYLRVQAQVNSLERQLEQAQGAQQQIEENVQYASVYITAADSKRYFDPSVPVDPLTELQQAVESLGGSLQALLYIVIWVVVYAVIWLPIILVVRWVWMRFKRN